LIIFTIKTYFFISVEGVLLHDYGVIAILKVSMLTFLEL